MKRAEVKAIANELTAAQLDEIMSLHGEGLNAIKATYAEYVPKKDLDAITAELTELKKQPAPKDYTAELAELATLRAYKTETETQATAAKVTDGIKQALATANALYICLCGKTPNFSSPSLSQEHPKSIPT